MIKPEELRIGDYVRVCGDKCMIDSVWKTNNN